MQGFAFLAAGLVVMSSGAAAEPMAELVGSKRVLLVFAREADPAFVRQKALLESAETGALQDRDLLVLFVPTTGETRTLFGGDAFAYPAEALRRSLDIAPTSGFTALLVGKDGGVKWRTTTPARPDDIFSVIDAMPMRMIEMRRNGPAG